MDLASSLLKRRGRVSEEGVMVPYDSTDPCRQSRKDFTVDLIPNRIVKVVN